jgi:hypothetical protein
LFQFTVHIINSLFSFSYTLKKCWKVGINNLQKDLEIKYTTLLLIHQISLMKKILLSLFLTLSLHGGLLYADNHRGCGTMDYLAAQKQQDPGLESRMAQIEAFTQSYLQQGNAKAPGVLYTIPVVVHVVYNTTSQNISDAQIQSQINILNQDFRKLNSDVSLVPSAFASLAADAQIEFCLATVSPTGASTNGIVRRQTTVTSFSSNNAVKFTAQGGSDAWNTGQYLNLWVCNLGGGLLGYAQFPGGAANTDGVVCNVTAFGNTGTAAAPFNKGRTATHEVGHWLNLRHIWGDANCGSDLVNDTPTQQTSNYGCPTFPKVTCSNGPNGDMFMNYMDYTNDACMYMFSSGQKSRMLALFATGGARASLTTSTGCSGGGTTTCGTPSGLAASSITSTSATVSWAAVSGAVSYNLNYKTSTATTWIAVNTTSTSRSLTGLTAGTTYNFRVQAVCSSASGAFSGTNNFTTTSSGTGITATIGTSTATTTTSPYGTYFMDHRVQYIITNAELVAGGWTSGNNFIRSLAFNASTSSGQTMNAFTIRIANTTSSSFGNSNYLALTSPVTVYSANYTPTTGWNTHTFTTPYSYNGTSNLLIDICWNNSSFTSDCSMFATTLTAYRALYTRQDVASGGVCATASGTRSYARANMRLAFSNTSAREAEGLQIIEPIEMADGFQLYPNPNNGTMNLEYNLSEEHSNMQLEVFNLMGTLVYSLNESNQPSGKYIIPVDVTASNDYHLSSGMYLCQMKVNGKVYTKRFVINR